MNFRPKYYIVFPYNLIERIEWPINWHACSGNLPKLLQVKLCVKAIGSEIKLIWNEQHRMDIIKNHNVTYEQLEDYLKADCSILSFQSKGTMKRAEIYLRENGADNFVCVDTYRDVILQQAFFKQNKEFKKKILVQL